MYNLIELFGVILDNFVLNLDVEAGLNDEILEKRIVSWAKKKKTFRSNKTIWIIKT